MLKNLSIVIVESILILLHLTTEGGNRGIRPNDPESCGLMGVVSSVAANFGSFHPRHQRRIPNLVYNVSVKLKIRINL